MIYYHLMNQLELQKNRSLLFKLVEISKISLLIKAEGPKRQVVSRADRCVKVTGHPV